MRPFRAFLPFVLALFPLTGALAQDDTPDVLPEPNPVCGSEISAGRFQIAQIAPAITGSWKATAPGLGMTAGVQTFTVEISFERGRLYLSGGGRKTELVPVYGTRKALRYDPVRQQTLSQEAWAVQVDPDEVALVAGCELGIEPQFTWRMGSGAQSSSGIYSFFGPGLGLGTMWNSAQGAREVLLQR